MTGVQTCALPIFAQWQQAGGKALARLIGFDVRRQSDIRVERLWRRDHELGSIELLVLRTPGVADVAIYWCRPIGAGRNLPAMICLQGHSTGMHCSIGVSAADGMVDQPVAGDRDFALQCLKRGIAAVCVEQRGFGLRRENPDNRTDCEHMAMRALMLGRTLLGERVADVQLALRWLLQQDEVDPARIGIMGNSAGGTTAFYSAALLDEICLAVPSCSFGPLSDTWFAGSRCVCGYVPGILNCMDLPDVLALRAPRPVVIVGGETDYHSPGPALRRAFATLQQRYATAGTGDDVCHLIIGPEGHRFYADLAWPIIEKLL